MKTAQARSADGSMSTVGDIGYVDGDGYLYLTDRASFMIIVGGVNVYPQECEHLLITHVEGRRRRGRSSVPNRRPWRRSEGRPIS